jgi:hypothetical protein
MQRSGWFATFVVDPGTRVDITGINYAGSGLTLGSELVKDAFLANEALVSFSGEQGCGYRSQNP